MLLPDLDAAKRKNSWFRVQGIFNMGPDMGVSLNRGPQF